MLVVVKMHHTKKKLFEIKGKIPNRLINYLKREYGSDLLLDGEDESLIDPFDTDWYKNINAKLTPGKALKHYRENRKLSQNKLAELLEKASGRKLTRQKVSDMENDRRAISKEIARKAAVIFGTSVERFI